MSDPIIEELLNHRSVLGLALLGGEDAYTNVQKNLLSFQGTTLEEMDSITGWAKRSTSTIALNTSEYKTGTGSIKLTTAEAADGYFQKVVNWSLSSSSKIQFWYYMHDPLTQFDNTKVVRIALYTASDASKGFFKEVSFATLSVLSQGWHSFKFLGSDFSVTGGATWDEPIVLARFTTTSSTGNVYNSSFDSLNYGAVGRPIIHLSFDDAGSGIYTDVFPILRAHNIRGTFYVATHYVGGASSVTVSQLQEMDAAGWAIGNHTRNHVDLTTLSLAEQETELAGAKADLDSWGLTKASSYVAYPFGTYNSDTITAMKNLGMLTGRTVVNSMRPASPTSPEFILPYMDYYLLPTHMSVSGTLSDALSFIDYGITNNHIEPFLYHEMAGEWSIDEYKTFINYIVSKRHNYVSASIDDIWKSLSGPIALPRIRL